MCFLVLNIISEIFFLSLLAIILTNIWISTKVTLHFKIQLRSTFCLYYSITSYEYILQYTVFDEII